MAEALVENVRQARKVRWIVWGLAAWMVGSLFWAADMASSFGLSPGDGGVLRPAAERWGVAGLLALVGVAPFLGMVLYAGRYIVRMTRSGDTVQTTLAGAWKPFVRDWPVAAFGGVKEHDGEFYAGGVSVDAPWLTLRIDGRRYIIDMQAERVDHQGIERLVKDGRKR